MQVKWFLASLAFLSLIATSCGKKDEKEKGASVLAKLALSNSTSTSLTASCSFAQCWTPSSFGLKLVSVMVSPDAGGAQSGPAGLIWANPDCAIKTSTTEIDEKEYEYENASDCTDDQVGSFFEFARPTAEVNADLNSQPHKIVPGTYNYVQLEFCKGGPKTKNGQFKAEGMNESYEFSSGMCGVDSVKADPPIVVEEGQSVTVSLTYDLTNSIYIGHADSDPSYCYLNEDKSVVRCTSGLQDLEPGFVKE